MIGNKERMQKILEIIREKKMITASEIVRETGFSRVTVERYLAFLIGAKKIVYRVYGQVRVFSLNDG